MDDISFMAVAGVIDPRNGETISIYEAINEGIVSQTKGVYMNPDDGTSMPIPEAMNKVTVHPFCSTFVHSFKVL